MSPLGASNHLLRPKTLTPVQPQDPPDPLPVVTFSLLGDGGFNQNAPTLKNGVPLTGDLLDWFNALHWWRVNPAQHMDNSVEDLAGSDNIYQLGRALRERIQVMLTMLRLTGDLRFLDSVLRWCDIARQTLAVGYRDHDTSTVTWSASPYLCWVARGNFPADLHGTDLSVMNECKWHATLAEVAYACYLNRNFTSPVGARLSNNLVINYELEYARWMDYLRNHFVPKWSGGSLSGWRVEYMGVRRDPTYSNGNGPGVGPVRYGRPALDEWPILVNGGETHSSLSQGLMAYYWHKLTGNQSALTEFNWMMDAFLNTDSEVITGPLGDTRIWPHTMQSQGSNSHYGQRAAYVQYDLGDLFTMMLEGGHEDVNEELLTEMVRAVQSYFWLSGVTATGVNTTITKGDILGEEARGTHTSDPHAGRTQGRVVYSNYFVGLPFEDSEGLSLSSEATRMEQFSWYGTTAQPKTPFITAAQFVKDALPLFVSDPEDPVPVPGGGVFDFTGKSNFNPDAPVLKNGVAVTGQALATWNGIRWLVENHQTKRYVENPGGTVDELFALNDLYHLGRMAGVITNELAVVFRLTGWLKALDEWVRLADIQFDTLVSTYLNPASGVLWPTHPYRRWVWGQSDAKYTGADHHLQDNIRTHTPIAHLLYALRKNQHLSSPANHNYAAKADKWEAYLREWMKVWGGSELDLGIDENGDPASGWSANYEGNSHVYYRNLVGARAAVGSWPIVSRHHTHTHVGASALHVWLGRGIPSLAAASPVGIQGITELYFQRNLYYYGGAYGTQMVWPRSLWRTGHSSGGNYPQPSTYVRFIAMDLMNLWLEGVIPSMPQDWAAPGVRTWNQYMLNNLSSNEGMKGDLFAGGVPPAAAVNKNLQFMPQGWVSAAGEGFASSRSVSNLVSSCLCMFMPWDTPDNHMQQLVWQRMGTSSLYREGSDPVAKPRVLSPSIGLMLKQLGAKNWNLSES